MKHLTVYLLILTILFSCQSKNLFKNRYYLSEIIVTPVFLKSKLDDKIYCLCDSLSNKNDCRQVVKITFIKRFISDSTDLTFTERSSVKLGLDGSIDSILHFDITNKNGKSLLLYQNQRVSSFFFDTINNDCASKIYLMNDEPINRLLLRHNLINPPPPAIVSSSGSTTSFGITTSVNICTTFAIIDSDSLENIMDFVIVVDTTRLYPSLTSGSAQYYEVPILPKQGFKKTYPNLKVTVTTNLDLVELDNDI